MTNLRDEDDEELLAAARQLGKQHRVLIASLREEVLDGLRHSPVHTYDEALSYCGRSTSSMPALRCTIV